MANALTIGFDPYADTQGLAEDAVKPGFDPYADTQGLDTAGIFDSIGRGFKKAAKAAVSVYKAVSPIVGPIVEAARTTLKTMGPVGAVANGAIGALGAGLTGKNVGDIALAAATGAAPPGIDRAIQAGADLIKGKPILKVALGQAVQSFAPGSSQRFAFNAAVDVLGKATKIVSKTPALRQAASQNVKVALGEARRALASEGQRRAFDSAIGTVARAASGVRRAASPTTIAVRRNVLQSPKVLPAPPRRAPISVINPNVRAVVATIRRSPGLAARTPAEIAKKIGQPIDVVTRVLRLSPARLGWKPLSRGAAAFILRHVRHAPLAALRDTRGLTSDGATYTVEPGDFPGRIAKKIAPGNAENRWPQLIASNPQKKTKPSPIGKVFDSLFAGEKLIVPPSWRKVAAPPLVTLPEVVITPGASVPTITTVSTTPDAQTDTAAVLQAKATLIAWSKTDGLSEAGFADYGMRAEDMSTTFGVRDRFVAKSFASWSNRTAKTTLASDGGELTPSLAAALRAWAERRAAIPLPAGPLPQSPAPPSMPPPFGLPGTPSKTADVIPLPVPPSLQPAQPGSGDGIIPVAAAAGLGWAAAGPIGAAIGGLAGVLLFA